jgi:MFS transporter, MHS family, citrate/tricarballylate:H+ symporter
MPSVKRSDRQPSQARPGRRADPDAQRIPAGTGSGLPAHQIVAVALGNALQFYDFLTYGFFASQIGYAFFPSRDATASLIASLATFGAGYLTRPVGAVLIGIFGDRVGRKPAMLLSFALMTVGILGLALTPAYERIGIAAPICAIAFRLIQGFGLGGEVGPSTAYLMEAAPPARRGLYVSLQYMTQDAAVLLAGLIGFALANTLSVAALNQWGWRLAFLLGAGLVPIGFILRRRLPETLQAGDPDAPARAEKASLRAPLIGLIMLSAATVCIVVMNYMTTFATHTLGLQTNVSFLATVTLGTCGILCDPIAGWLCDRFGRKPIMIAPWTLLLLIVVPCFEYLIQHPSRLNLLACTALLNIPICIAAVSVLVSVAESVPRRSRSAMIATLYAISATIFGGSTQLVVTWLIRTTGNSLAPAWYMAGAAAVGLLAMCCARETAPNLRLQPED